MIDSKPGQKHLFKSLWSSLLITRKKALLCPHPPGSRRESRPLAFYILAVLILASGMMVDACAYFQPPSWKGSSPDPPKTDPRLERGRQLLKMGKHKEAIAEFEAVLKKTPGNPIATAQLKLAQKEMTEDRERVIQSLIQLHEKGLQHYHKEEYVRAGNRWREAIHLYGDRNDPTIERELPFQIQEVANDLNRTLHLLVEQGVFLYRQGKLETAVTTWEDVLKIEPQHSEAKDFLQKARLKIDTLEKLTSSPDLTIHP